MGIITETGSGVVLLKKGDRVVMPFNVADGRCRNCEEGKTAFCTGVNPVSEKLRSKRKSRHDCSPCSRDLLAVRGASIDIYNPADIVEGLMVMLPWYVQVFRSRSSPLIESSGVGWP